MFDPAMHPRTFVTTGARLHFGPLAVHAREGRSFGGVGLMIDAPATEVAIERAERDEICGNDPQGRIAQFLSRLRAPGAVYNPPYRITLLRSAPPHAGLGSGTQLSLALEKCLSLMSGEPDVAPAELARRAGRAGRSAIGTHGFSQGGFLVDAGIAPGSSIGELATREPCPEQWRFLLAAPRAEAGLSGIAEQQAFGTLAPMDMSTTGALCRIVLTDWLPAIRAADFAGFCSALDEYGRIIGGYFAAVQGGIYADPRMARLAADLHRAGLRGVAQSSWGPTIAVCCESEFAATRLQADLTAATEWRDCRFDVVRPLNAGARISVEM